MVDKAVLEVLEPGVREGLFFSNAVQLSTAISLKRIADALERQHPVIYGGDLSEDAAERLRELLANEGPGPIIVDQSASRPNPEALAALIGRIVEQKMADFARRQSER